MRTPSSRSRLAAAALALLLASAPGALPAAASAALAPPAAPPLASLPENAEARAALADVITAPVSEAAAHAPLVLAQATGAARVSFRPTVDGNALYLVFANARGAAFPVAGAGTWVIKRSMRDGSLLHVKVFLQDDEGCYLRLFPDGNRTLMDIVLFGQPFQSGVPLALRLGALLSAPFQRIVDLTRGSVGWAYLLAPRQTEDDRRLVSIAQAIRARLPGLRDMDDGAMDAAGRMVSIATGAPAGRGGFNCSGFAKWVADGFFAPLAGHPMDLAPLKARDAGIEKTWSARYEELYDPWFGLDWSRGIAKSLALARDGRPAADGEVDVRDDAFVPWIADQGYPLSSLAAQLYLLARARPGAMYLGSVNAASALQAPEGIPTLRQHHHVVVLLPWFDAAGAFHVTVFERNVETGIPSLLRRFPGEYVALVRIPADGVFALPRIE